MKQFFHRHQPSGSGNAAILSGVGGTLAIALVAGLTHLSGVPLLMAPFGASCVLLFSVAASPLSQPVNVVGGHLVSMAIGIALQSVLPNEWWAIALAVGLAIAAMAALRITHPPAGANPIVAFAADPGWSFLLFPTLSGSIALVAFAVLFHKLTAGNIYPAKA